MTGNHLPSSRASAATVCVAAALVIAAVSPAAATDAAPSASPVVASTLSVSAPASVPVDAPFTVTVRATGAHHKVDTGFRGTVKLSAAHAELPRSYTFTASDHGVHRFTVVLDALGRRTVTALDSHGHGRGLSGQASVTAKARATKTTVGCGASAVAYQGTGTCAVTVADHSPGHGTRPKGVVKLSATSGHFGPPATCTLPASGADRCVATYHSGNDGTIPVTATFVPAASDRTHAKSVGRSPVLVCPYRWTVGGSGSSDSNPGTCNKPFATLAKALSVAKSGDSVKLAPGSAYPTGSSPLVVPAGVTITGQHTVVEPGVNGLIIGDLVLSNPDSSLVRLGVEGTVSSSGGDESLSDVSVFSASSDPTCIDVTAGSILITGSSVHSCDVGIAVSGTGAITVTDTSLHNGDVNVSVGPDATADLNGGDTLECAATADLETSATADIDASNDLWDHATPTSATTSPPAGVDIYYTGTGTVLALGAAAGPSPCA